MMRPLMLMSYKGAVEERSGGNEIGLLAVLEYTGSKGGEDEAFAVQWLSKIYLSHPSMSSCVKA